MFADLTFLSPWILTALAALPVLWWLLRVMPPKPRIVKFPAFFLLKDLVTPLKSVAHMPWWLLLLRLIVAALFIVALADPVLHPVESLPGNARTPVLITIDNGWSAAVSWHSRQDKLKEYIAQIRRDDRPVIFLPTAPSDEDGQLHTYGPMDPARAEAWIGKLKPQPWPATHKDAAELAQKTMTESGGDIYTVFLSDGTQTEDTKDLVRRMRTVVTDDKVNNPHVFREEEKGFSLERLHALAQDQEIQIVAYGEGGSVVDEMKTTLPKNETIHKFTWDMLPEVRNKTVRLALRDPEMASTTILANAQWHRHPVGIIADAAQKESRDFLSEVYYLRRALEANSDITIDTLDTLLKGDFSALALPDSTPLTTAERTDLLNWVQQGGFLIRFAGPNLAAGTADALLPVPLRSGQRAMEGAMTWEKPVHLGNISEQSPLFGLSVPQDVTVTRQVLADPAPEVFEKTWLQLEDGTPLITGGKEEKGTIVLIHTSAGPDWSNFCYSGLFVESLQRMISLSNGISDYKARTTLPPLSLLDGFGRMTPPDGRSIITPIKPDGEFTPAPQTPPGLYGNAQDYKSFNLGAYLPKMQPLKDIPAGVTTTGYDKAGETQLKPPLIKWALLLLLLDTLVTFRMRGVVAFATVLLAIVLVPAPVQAAETKDLVTGVYLAYIETGDGDLDRTSYNGLKGLEAALDARTTVKVQDVVGVNPDTDQLSYYPVIYWPMTEQQTGLSVTAAHNIQNYLSQGGMILFDTRDRQFGDTDGAIGTKKLKQLTQNIQIPELAAITKDHILTRSFYLLDDFPGRYVGSKIWVEKEPSPRHDAVTSVVIGGNDWAAAWSRDPSDRARFMVEPGGEQQREMAYRFGINLVMVSLTGNYKADQVHVPYILERIGQ